MTDADPIDSLVTAHVIDAGDGVCGDCLWCDENIESDCIVPDDAKCAWCGHCLGNHGTDLACTQRGQEAAA
jgi:hypothetical protein